MVHTDERTRPATANNKAPVNDQPMRMLVALNATVCSTCNAALNIVTRISAQQLKKCTHLDHRMNPAFNLWRCAATCGCLRRFMEEIQGKGYGQQKKANDKVFKQPTCNGSRRFASCNTTQKVKIKDSKRKTAWATCMLISRTSHRKLAMLFGAWSRCKRAKSAFRPERLRPVLRGSKTI